MRRVLVVGMVIMLTGCAAVMRRDVDQRANDFQAQLDAGQITEWEPAVAALERDVRAIWQRYRHTPDPFDELWLAVRKVLAKAVDLHVMSQEVAKQQLRFDDAHIAELREADARRRQAEAQRNLPAIIDAYGSLVGRGGLLDRHRSVTCTTAGVTTTCR